MAIRPILVADEPVLRERTKRVPSFDAGLHRLLDDMLATMRDAPGVGLAANQVGVSLQVAVIEVEGRITELVNPQVVKSSGEQVDWEGCLSIPDLRGLVPRHPAVRVRGLDREGRPLDYVASGFEARIVQHEFDHLNGVVFLDRMRDLHSLSYLEEWEEYMLDRQQDLEETAVG